MDIGAQVQAEEQLKQSQQLIDDTPFMITRCSRDLRYLFVSRAYARMLGRDPRDLQGRSIVEVMREAGFAAIKPYIDRVLTGVPVEYESDVPFAAVGTRTLDVIYKPDIKDGQTIGWMASILDITDRKSARDACGPVSSTLRSTPSSPRISTAASRPGMGQRRVFGYTADEMVGKPVRLLIPEQRQSEEDDILKRLRHDE